MDGRDTGRRPAGVPSRAARQRADGGARGPDRARGAPLHPLLGLSQRLPGLRADGRPCLRIDIPRPDRCGAHPAAGRYARRQGRSQQLAAVCLQPVRSLLRRLSGEDRHSVAPRRVAAPAHRTIRDDRGEAGDEGRGRGHEAARAVHRRTEGGRARTRRRRGGTAPSPVCLRRSTAGATAGTRPPHPSRPSAPGSPPPRARPRCGPRPKKAPGTPTTPRRRNRDRDRTGDGAPPCPGRPDPLRRARSDRPPRLSHRPLAPRRGAARPLRRPARRLPGAGPHLHRRNHRGGARRGAACARCTEDRGAPGARSGLAGRVRRGDSDGFRGRAGCPRSMRWTGW